MSIKHTELYSIICIRGEGYSRGQSNVIGLADLDVSPVLFPFVSVYTTFAVCWEEAYRVQSTGIIVVSIILHSQFIV